MDYRRYHQPGGCYFFTTVTEARRPILIEHLDRLKYAITTTRRRHPFEIDAIVVLPDHLHTIWRLPPDDGDFSTRWRVLKRLFSSGFVRRPSTTSQRSKVENGIWQRRFWEHCIRDEGDWRRHMDYIHYNPVKHGYCAAPADWPHSSFRRLVAKGWYDAAWGSKAPVDFERTGME
jgi:putative transposase